MRNLIIRQHRCNATLLCWNPLCVHAIVILLTPWCDNSSIVTDGFYEAREFSGKIRALISAAAIPLFSVQLVLFNIFRINVDFP
jgi:hypothetical protein